MNMKDKFKKYIKKKSNLINFITVVLAVIGAVISFVIIDFSFPKCSRAVQNPRPYGIKGTTENFLGIGC